MLPFLMIALLAVLAFLCMSHVIPALARRKKLPNPPSEVDSEPTALRYTHPHARSLSLAKNRK
jgi:predicted MFS family arabinose efflux permease